MLDKKTLLDYIFEQIPISKALGIDIESLSLNQIVMTAPISNNVNHKKTVFGGSLQAVATLACWSLVFVNLKELNDLAPFEIVISESNIQYFAPVTGDFKVKALLPNEHSWQRFIRTLKRHNKARIQIAAEIHESNTLAVSYQGNFVALKK